MRTPMNVIKNLEIKKSDFKNLDTYLKDNELLDSKGLWFAGFNDSMRGSQNTMARNLFYGNSQIMIFSINNDDVYYLQNTRKGLQVILIGKTTDKYRTHIRRRPMNPGFDFQGPNEQYFEVKVTKNKAVLKEFANTLKA